MEKKVDFGSEPVGHHGGGGNFHHHADGQVGSDRDSRDGEFGGHLGQDCAGLAEFGQGGHQREHDPDVAQSPGTKDRAKLSPEHRQVEKRQAEAPEPERWVGLGRGPDAVGDELVRAEVKGPERHWATAGREDYGGIGEELFLFGRWAIGVKEEEFGPVQADTGRPAVEAGVNLGGKLDVAPKLDCMTVKGLGREMGQVG